MSTSSVTERDALSRRIDPRRTLRAAVNVALFAGAWSFPAVLVLTTVGAIYAGGWGWDLRATYDAAVSFLHHRLPYPEAHMSALTGGQGFVYPLVTAAAFVPLGALPWTLAVVVYALVSVGCIVWALQLLGLRDWRCYLAVLLAYTMQDSIVLGTLTPVLFLLIAVLWRYRDRPAVAGPALAAVVAAKLFLWPLGLWFLATRRWRTSALATGLGAAAIVVTTAPFGVSAVTRYRDVIDLLARFEAPFSFSPIGLLASTGVSLETSTLVVLALSIPILAGILRAGRRGDDLLALRLALAAAFVCSPIVWGHYFILLFVPLALLQPRLSPVWFATSWIGADTPLHSHHPELWVILALVLGAVQLGFVPTPRRLGTRSGVALASTAGTALFVVMAYAIASHTLLTAALLPAGRGEATGIGFVEIRPSSTRVCIRGAADPGFGPLHASVIGRRGTVTTAPIRLEHEGAAWACGRLRSLALAASVERHPGDFRLQISSRDGAVLAGPLEERVQAGRPPGATR